MLTRFASFDEIEKQECSGFKHNCIAIGKSAIFSQLKRNLRSLQYRFEKSDFLSINIIHELIHTLIMLANIAMEIVWTDIYFGIFENNNLKPHVDKMFRARPANMPPKRTRSFQN